MEWLTAFDGCRVSFPKCEKAQGEPYFNVFPIVFTF